MIENDQEYRAVRGQLADLESRLAALLSKDTGAKRFEIVGVRKMIVRLHHELADYESFAIETDGCGQTEEAA